MKSIDFPNANLPLAKEQPQYQTLFVFFDKKDEELPMTMCFQLSPEELAEINSTGGKLWFTQITFGRGFSPIRMSTQNPFQEIELPISSLEPVDENRVSAQEWDSTHYKWTEGAAFPGQQCATIGPCANCGRDEQDHYWSSRQCNL